MGEVILVRDAGKVDGHVEKQAAEVHPRRAPALFRIAEILQETPQEGIRVRLRSRFMTINQVAERHHGGGHARAAGATVYSGEEMLALIREADEEAREYKESHQGWL